MDAMKLWICDLSLFAFIVLYIINHESRSEQSNDEIMICSKFKEKILRPYNENHKK